MGTYVDIGPVHTWYEARGQGEPLVLLHAGLDTNASWGGELDALAEHFRVLAPERRGHGHTPDVDGPLSYHVMAGDTAAFVETVIGSPVHVVGWSDGAILGMMLALSRPDLVSRLVLIGGAADVSAYAPEFLAATRLSADSEVYQPFRAVYDVVSPDGPEHWQVMFSKMTSMWQTEPHIPLAHLRDVRARTLVMCGDDDLVSLEHTVAVYRAIPDAELAVVPGTSHLAPLEKPDLVNRLILDFLRLEPVRTVLPVRRALAPLEA
jgi:pimeloyl-ACP methyl ester carboxylesterase